MKKGWTHSKDYHDKSGKAIKHSLSAQGIQTAYVNRLKDYADVNMHPVLISQYEQEKNLIREIETLRESIESDEFDVYTKFNSNEVSFQLSNNYEEDDNLTIACFHIANKWIILESSTRKGIIDISLEKEFMNKIDTLTYIKNRIKNDYTDLEEEVE